jgi:hypothetical protein
MVICDATIVNCPGVPQTMTMNWEILF